MTENTNCNDTRKPDRSLLHNGQVQIISQTFCGIVYAVGTESATGLGKDTDTVLKGGALWYNGWEALGKIKDPEESDWLVRQEAAIYETLGKHDHIVDYRGMEVAVLPGAGPEPKAWALRFERAIVEGSECGGFRGVILKRPKPSQRERLDFVVQFATGVVHVHSHGLIWGDLSTRNALLFENGRLKLCDFGFSGPPILPNQESPWFSSEPRYCPPGPDPEIQPHPDGTSTLQGELYALGSAIWEITQWEVPYGDPREVSYEEVYAARAAGKMPETDDDNPAKAIIEKCWRYGYETSDQVLDELKNCLDGMHCA